MTINDRIKQFIDVKGLNMNSFAQEAGIEYTSVFNVVSENGRRNKPSADFLEKMKLSFDTVNLNWIVAGVGNMLIDRNPLTLEFTKQDLNGVNGKLDDLSIMTYFRMLQSDLKKIESEES